jgi:hypothetical protein
MAWITKDQLVRLIRNSSDYEALAGGVAPERALYIQLGSREDRAANSTEFEAVNGDELIVKLNKDGKVIGIELL